MSQPIISCNKAKLAATVIITLILAGISQLMYSNISYGQGTYVNPRLILETFTARGLIGSLIFNNAAKIIIQENQHTNNINNTATPNTQNKNSYILAGTWGLNVVNRKITYFELNFTMVHADGTDRHTHEFTNFKQVSVIPILLDPKGITFIGMMDIKLNGGDKWFGVPVSVAIGKNFNTISVLTNPKYTNDHFMGQSIHGVFTSLKDKYGTELVSTRPLA
ncbi:MAG: hypothetical protein WA364_01220 [Candidatus Nitrosopolaris sp.]